MSKVTETTFATVRQAVAISEAMRHFAEMVMAVSNADDTMTIYHHDRVEAALAPLGMNMRDVSKTMALATEYARKRKAVAA